MTLDKVLEIANECVYNDNIPTEGLTLKYIIDKKAHEKLDKELFFKTNNNNPNFKHNEVIEINIVGITFIFEQS